jgi:uncharacterized RDD family membrane protein YckC
MNYDDRPRSLLGRIGSVILAGLLAAFGVALICSSLVAVVVFFVGGLGFANPIFLVLALLCAVIFVFSGYFSLRVLLPFGRLLISDE